MKTIEYKFVDKSEWPRGEWDNEPDKIQYQDSETGLPCIIKRNPTLGFLCGYVGVNKNHMLFKVEYDMVSELIEYPHGGLTFSDLCQKNDDNLGICHVTEKDEDDQIWWFGFDCGHGGDLAPGMFVDLKKINPNRDFFKHERYLNIEYVKSEISSLAKQLKNIELGGFTNEKP